MASTATLIPALNGCLSRMTSGERRFARALESRLEDDYLCWYEPRVGTGLRSRYTDFVVLHPGRGLLLLEVKDWKRETIRRADRESFELLLDTGVKHVRHPLEQARQCMYRLLDTLRADPALRHAEGPHTGALVCPYAFGVVLAGMTRAEFEAGGLDAVLDAHLVICRDEMTITVDAEAFQTRLWNMFPVRFPVRLTLPQLDRVRWHLFPEIRITPPSQASLLDAADAASDESQGIAGDVVALASGGMPGDAPSGIAEKPPASDAPDIVRVMDIEQERLARGLGEGHRVIHGVAGSGKTMILGYRCLHLANLLAKPILVLCFNVALAAHLRQMLAAHGLGEKVSVCNFHEWCARQLRTYHVEPPADGPGYHERSVATLIRAVDSERVPRAQYGAVLIDEGHDFEADWLRLVVGMIDPASNSLLLLYDDAQSIYAKGAELGFSLSSAGVQARGRTTILRLNYRNTDEITAFACRFARDWLVADERDGERAPTVVPERAGRHGPAPVVRRFSNVDAEADYVARCANAWHERGTPWSDIAILYRATWQGETLARALTSRDVPFHWLLTGGDKRRLARSEPTVKLMTMHSSKGLEFPYVVVAGTGAMPGGRGEATTEAKLLYVAMTRATDHLMITADRPSAFVERLAA